MENYTKCKFHSEEHILTKKVLFGLSQGENITQSCILKNWSLEMQISMHIACQSPVQVVFKSIVLDLTAKMLCHSSKKISNF